MFPGVGVMLSIGLAMTINLPHAYWIVILFVSRCLMPMQDRPGALFKNQEVRTPNSAQVFLSVLDILRKRSPL